MHTIEVERKKTIFGFKDVVARRYRQRKERNVQRERSGKEEGAFTKLIHSPPLPT